MVDWNWLLAEAVEAAPAVVVVLVMLWVFSFCWRIIRRLTSFFSRTEDGRRFPAAQQGMSVRREPTFGAPSGAAGSADIREVAATVEALRMRISALEQRLGEPAPPPTPSGKRQAPGDFGDTVVAMERSRSSKRRIDLG